MPDFPALLNSEKAHSHVQRDSSTTQYQPPLRPNPNIDVLPLEVQARIFSHLPLDEITRTYPLSQHQKANYPKIASYLGAVGDSFGHVALHQSSEDLPRTLSPQHYGKFLRLISTLRDPDITQRRKETVQQSLRDTEFFKAILDNCDGNEVILTKLVKNWAYLPADDRKATKKIIIQKYPKFIMPLLFHEASFFRRVEQTNGSALALDELQNIAGPHELFAIAQHPNTHSDTLQRMAETSTDPDTRIALATHIHSNKRTIDALFKTSTDPFERKLLLNNRRLSVKLFQSATTEERTALLNATDTIPRALLRLIYTGLQPDEYLLIARHQNATEEVLAKLVEASFDGAVRLAIAENSKSNFRTLKRLYDTSPIQTVVNSDMSKSLIMRLFDKFKFTNEPQLYLAIARHPNSTAYILEELAMYFPTPEVLAAIAKNPKTDSETLTKNFKSRPSREVYQDISLHPNTATMIRKYIEYSLEIDAARNAMKRRLGS